MKYAPLIPPKIDDRREREIVDLALLRSYEASNKTLNDFSVGSPMRVFAEQMAFIYAELVYSADKLGIVLLIRFLQILGIQRRIGLPAVANLQFSLVMPLGDARIIPAGFVVLTQDRTVKFHTNEQLVIPAGETTGIVTATASVDGSSGNVAKNSINTPIQSLAYVNAVTNLEPAYGGLDDENNADLFSRAFRELRRRAAITAEDFEIEVRKILGANSPVKAVSFKPGTIDIYALNENGAPLNDAQKSILLSTLATRSQLGLSLIVRDIELLPIDVEITARISRGLNPQIIANRINSKIQVFLRPGRLPLGRTILVDDLRFQVRATGVEFVDIVAIGAHGSPSLNGLNFQLKSTFSAVQLVSLRVLLSDGKNSFNYQF